MIYFRHSTYPIHELSKGALPLSIGIYVTVTSCITDDFVSGNMSSKFANYDYTIQLPEDCYKTFPELWIEFVFYCAFS